jgi:hypothetical protein
VSLSSKIIPSPVGRLRLVASDEGLAAILWDNDRPLPVHLAELVENPAHPTLICAEKELNEYFSHKRTAFFRDARYARDLLSKAGMERLAGHPFRRNTILRPDCKSTRQPKSHARSRRCKRPKSHSHHRSVPPGHRRKRQADRLRRRPGNKRPASVARGRRPNIIRMTICA